MIGRKQRTRVVFIDGIPIESATLDAGESGVQKEDATFNPAALKELEPRALFDKYDADGSGGIDIDEFKVLLDDLNIKLSEPKALAYFKRCDKMRRGHISFEEFRLALYTCDPKNPNRTMGFAPGQALSPKDLFEMFDRDEQGAIDRATFIEVLEFLGHKLPLDRMEGIFAAHEDPELEMMPYYQFKKVWLTLVDVRAELRNRHEKFNRFATSAALMKKLEILVNDEERQEARTLLEAATTLDEERIAAHRRWLIDESITLSKLVLAEAIDAAGQVYLFGKGPFGRFDGEPMEPDFVDFMNYEVVRDLWKTRVRPDAEFLTLGLKALSQKRTDDSETSQADDAVSDSDESDDPARTPPISTPASSAVSHHQESLTRAKMTLVAAAKAFSGRQVSLVPTFLWGKRVNKVALGPTVAYALTDSGEVFCWGGSKKKWRYFYDSATLDRAPVTEDASVLPFSGQKIKASPADRPLTVRTEMLKQAMPSQVERNQVEHDQLYLRQKYMKTFLKPNRPLPTDEQKRSKLELLGHYFDLLPPDPPPPTAELPKKVNPTPRQAQTKREILKSKLAKKTCGASDGKPLRYSLDTTKAEPATATTPPKPAAPRIPPTYTFLMETIEPDLNVDDLVVALELRGVHMAKQTRMDLIDKLGNCLELELECLGPKFHDHMKEQDKAARRAKHDRLEKKLQNILVKTTMLWNELRILQEDIVRIENDEFTRTENEYIEMKKRIARAKQKIKRQAREGYFCDGTDQGMLYMSGLTSRGAPQRFFNGEQALIDISVGSRHALAVHQTGKLYTWGVGTFGRLGGVRQYRHTSGGDAHSPPGEEPHASDGDDDIDAWHRDIHSPQTLAALDHLRFRSVCCGFSHSLALTSQGEVYVWGSATHGKLGIGQIVGVAKESFTLTPLRLAVPGGSTIRVRKMACGPSHSALLTTDGGLFVWGSGDGGKLGLGDGRDIGEDRVPRNGGQLRVIEVPTRVKLLAKENCVDVSCGTAHTAVLTAIVSRTGDSKVAGGRVYVAGSNHALGSFTPTFTPLHIPRVDKASSLEDEVHTDIPASVAITRVSCGNAHTALVSHDGELLTWGNNAGGCTGHPISIPLVKVPTRVACLYQYPRNLCLEKLGVVSYQSSQNASCIAEIALQKCEDPENALGMSFSQTQQEMCPFWQVKLGSMSRIERINIMFKRTPITMSSRTTQRADDGAGLATRRPMSSTSTSSTYRTSRPSSAGGSTGIKYVVLVSEVPFDTEERGKYAVAKAKGQSVFTSFTLERENQVQWSWSVPVDTYGRFVRVQVENAVAMLGLVSVGVVGMRADEYNGPRVSDVSCADGMTVAICRPLSSVDMVRERLERAVRADRTSLWILEQLETFHAFVQEELERKGSTGDDAVKPKCVLCKPKERCVICQLDDATFTIEIQKELAQKRKEREDQQQQQRERERLRQEEMVRRQKDLMRGGRGLAQNKGRESERRKAARDAKAKADAAAKAATSGQSPVEESSVQVLKRTLTLEEKCQKLLRLNMRTEEEDEEAERRLAAELFAIDPVAAMAVQSAKAKQHGTWNQAGENENQLVTKMPSRRSIFGRLAALFDKTARTTVANAAATNQGSESK